MTTSFPGAQPARARRRAVGSSRAKSRLLRLALSVAIAIVAAAVAGLPVFVFPPQGDPTDADLVYVIGPPEQPRLAFAAALQAIDPHAALLISVSDSRAGRGEKRFDASALEVCRRRGVICASPDPFTTAGETRLLRQYATEHETGKTVVVTFTPHVVRTRFIFAKCGEGDVTVVGVDTDLTLLDWVYEYAYQSAAFVKAWFSPCP